MITEVGITLDWEGSDLPAEGDVLCTSRSRYLITEIRRVKSRVHPCRFAIRALKVVEEDLDAPEGVRLHRFRWHPRGRKR